MSCGCAAMARADRHRAMVRTPTAQQPYPWPPAVAEALAGAIRSSRQAVLDARAWLATQPLGPRQWASQAELRRWEQQLLTCEQSLLRVGVAEGR